MNLNVKQLISSLSLVVERSLSTYLLKLIEDVWTGANNICVYVDTEPSEWRLVTECATQAQTRVKAQSALRSFQLQRLQYV